MSNFWKSTIVIASMDLIGVAATAFNSLILASVLGPEGIGTLSLLVSLPTLALVVSSLGLHFAIVYYLNQPKYSHTAILSTAFWIGLIISLVLVLAGILVFQQLQSFVPLASHLALVLAILSVFPLTWLLYFGDACLGLGFTVNAIFLRSLPSILYFLNCIFWVVILHKGITGAIFSYFIGNIVSAIIGLALLFQKGLIKAEINLEFVREGLGFGFTAHIGDVAQYLIYRADSLIINLFAGAGAVGYYTIAVRIAELVWLPSNALRTALLSRTSAQGIKANDSTALMSRYLLFLGIISGVGAFLLGYFVIHLWLVKYIPSINLLAILLPGAVAISVFRVLIGNVVGNGKPGKMTQISLIGLAAGMTLYLLFIPNYGALGAALSSTVLYTGEYILLIIYLVGVTKIPLRRMLFVDQADILYLWRFINDLSVIRIGKQFLRWNHTN